MKYLPEAPTIEDIMARKSFLDCKHENVQEFTECCLDCGYNIWTTKKEYLKDLQRQAGGKNVEEIRKLEKQLGIG